MTHATSPTATVRANARGERARARLLEAALSAFAQHGFHGTSTRHIADAAAMSPAAVYVHYRTKEDLLFQLSLAGHREIEGIVMEALTDAGSPPEALRTAVHAYAAWHARSHVTARVLQYEIGALAPAHAEEVAAIRRSIEALLRGVILDGVAAGSFVVDDVNMTALAVLSLGIDVARWFRDDGTWTAEEIGRHYGALALRMCGHTSEPTEARV